MEQSDWFEFCNVTVQDTVEYTAVIIIIGFSYNKYIPGGIVVNDDSEQVKSAGSGIQLPLL